MYNKINNKIFIKQGKIKSFDMKKEINKIKKGFIRNRYMSNLNFNLFFSNKKLQVKLKISLKNILKIQPFNP